MIFVPMQFTALDEENARKYSAAKISIIPFLKKQVIGPFEDALKIYSGCSNKKIPKSVEEIGLECSDVPGGKFMIKTIPKIKKPSYKDIYEEMQRFFWKGYNPVNVEKFLHDIREFKESITEKSVNQEISPKHEDLNEKLDKIDVSIVQNSEDIMIPAKGLMYLRAARLCDNLSQYVSDFDDALRKSAGVDENLKEKRVIEKQIGNILFVFRATPSESIKYGEIYGQLTEELSMIAGEEPKLPKTKAAQEKAIEKHNELKGEVNKNYKIILLGKDKKPHIELINMVERFEKIRDKYTEPSISESTSFYAIA